MGWRINIPKAAVDVLGVDDAVIVPVPEENMLLESGQRFCIRGFTLTLTR